MLSFLGAEIAEGNCPCQKPSGPRAGLDFMRIVSEVKRDDPSPTVPLITDRLSEAVRSKLRIIFDPQERDLEHHSLA